MENVRKRVDVRLFRSDEEEKILRRIARPTFVRQEIFHEHLVAIQNRKERVLLNKPIYVGMSVLDLSKHLMYDFYYNHLKKTYSDKIKLLYTDTDSVIIHVQTDDMYKTCKPTAQLTTTPPTTQLTTHSSPRTTTKSYRQI